MSDALTTPYLPPLLLPGGHLQTIYPSQFRSVPEVNYRRERLETEDNDFIDLDWLESGSERVAIILHGLEGSSNRGYVRGMARALKSAGWDIAALNFRGCSGETNRLLRSYHSGETGDLRFVLKTISVQERWQKIALIGFSLGANVLLKFLGEESSGLDSKVCAAVALSVPCDLEDSANQLAKSSNWIYMKKFLRYLKPKIEAKAKMFPDAVSLDGFEDLKSFHDFDGCYTAPIHGFRDEIHYWTESSSRQYLTSIKVPTLIVNALNDPFLGRRCYPYEEAKNNPNLRLLAPKKGGHNGFPLFNPEGLYWSEIVARDFIQQQIGQDSKDSAQAMSAVSSLAQPHA